jgi:hypothetical protein
MILLRSGAILGAFLGLQVAATAQVLAQKSEHTPDQQPPAKTPIVTLDPKGCTGIPPFVSCEIVTPQGRMILQIPQDQIDSLGKMRSDEK